MVVVEVMCVGLFFGCVCFCFCFCFGVLVLLLTMLLRVQVGSGDYFFFDGACECLRGAEWVQWSLGAAAAGLQ
jgi:hypothetical protein